MDSEEALKAFTEARNERDFVFSESRRIAARIQEDYRNDVIHRFRQAYPKAKNPTFAKASDSLGDKLQEVLKPYLEESRKITAQTELTVQSLTAKLSELAPLISLYPQVEESVYAVTMSDDFRTQSGPLGYARGRAEIHIDELAKVGVIGRVVQFGDHFEVRVPLDPVRIEVVKVLLASGKGFTLREFLKACWGHGVNPRVLSPQIPHGLEERYGLDYFGNEVKRGSGS